VHWRRRSHLTFWKIAFLAAANAAVVVFLVRNFSTPADIRTTSWESIVGLPNAQGDCLAGVQYGDLTGDGKDDALVQARPGCGDAGLSLWVYGMGDGKPSALWGHQGEPGLSVPVGDATVTQDGKLLVRDQDPDSLLAKAGLGTERQLDRYRVFQHTPDGFLVQDTWHDPVLLGQVSGTGGCLNVRAGPGTTAAVVDCVAEGTLIKLTDGPQESSGFTWWARAGGGWVAGQFLELTPGPDPDRASQ
jgi:hypothetical protein